MGVSVAERFLWMVRESLRGSAVLIETSSAKPCGRTTADAREDALVFIEECSLSDTPTFTTRDDRNHFVRFGVKGVPERVFVNPEGRIVGRHVGAVDQHTLRELFEELVDLGLAEMLPVSKSEPSVGVG